MDIDKKLRQLKILYAIQGTGNGHLSRAREIIPYLKKKGSWFIVSGIQIGISHCQYELKYVFKEMSFLIFREEGGIDYVNTYNEKPFNRFKLMK